MQAWRSFCRLGTGDILLLDGITGYYKNKEFKQEKQSFWNLVFFGLLSYFDGIEWWVRERV